MADDAGEHLSARAWLAAYAQRLGTEPPSAAEFATLLDLAGVAAHASQRVAAPVACWLAARAGVDPAHALTIAQEVTNDG